MRNYIVLAWVVFATSFLSIGQNSGFLGKKNLISFFSTSSVRAYTGVGIPVFDNYGNGYDVVDYEDNGTVRYRKKYFRNDWRISYTRVVNRKISLGLEGSYEYMKLPDGQKSKDASPAFNVWGMYGTFSVHGRNLISPLGFSFTLGIGPKFYLFDYARNYQFEEMAPVGIPVYPDYKQQLAGFDMFAQFSRRKALTSFLMLDYGLRVHTGFVFERSRTLESGKISSEWIYSGSSSIDPGVDYDQFSYYSKSGLKRQVFRENAFNILQFQLGLSFVL